MDLSRALLLVSCCCLPLVGARCGNEPASPLDPPEAYPQAHQVFQETGGFGDIVVSGPCAEESALVEARWSVGPWTPIGACAAGTYAGALPDQAVGSDRLEVRVGGLVVRTVDDVGVGLVIVIAGQSNAVGHATEVDAAGPLASVLSLEELGSEGVFRPAVDPMHRTAPIDGSPWPDVADSIVGSIGMPVMFVATASGGAGLINPASWSPGGFFYGRMLNNVGVATAGGACPAVVLWHQGERDAREFATAGASYQQTYDAYKSALVALADAIQSDMACAVPLVVAQIGPVAGLSEAELAPIRDAQRDAATASESIEPGPCTADLMTTDGTHLDDPQLAVRWFFAVEPLLYAVPTPGYTGCAP